MLDSAAAGRLLLTHDRATMPDFAYERVGKGQRMPGVIVVSDRMPLRQAIEELLVVNNCSREGEWEDRVLYLPL